MDMLRQYIIGRLMVLFVIITPLWAASEDPEIILQMTTEKTSVYIGESFRMTLDIKQHHRSRAVDMVFSMPEMENFRTTMLKEERLMEERDYTTTRFNYVMHALQSGQQRTLPAQMKVATLLPTRNSIGVWASSLSWKNYVSNTMGLDVKPLPEGVELAGTFTLSTVVDTTEPKANEAVHVTLNIRGSGNLEAIPLLRPVIAGVTVFGEAQKVSEKIEKGHYMGSVIQKLAFISDRSFTIAPFTLHYFDTVSKTVKMLESEAIHISVKRAPSTLSAVVSEKSENTEPSQPWERSFAQGTFLGLLLALSMMILPWRRYFSKKNRTIEIDLNDQKSVLMALLQHRDDPEVAKMVQRLEGNLYEGKSDAIEKKLLKRLLEKGRK